MADGTIHPGVGFTVAEVQTSTPNPPDDAGRKPGQRDQVIEAVLAAGVAFWRDGDGAAFATVAAGAGSGQQRYRVRSPAFALVVRGLYAEANKRTVRGRVLPGSLSDQALAEALPTFEAMALRVLPVRNPDVRVCRWEGAVWLDLGCPAWRLVRVQAGHWEVLDGADVPLIRPDAMRPLPEPARADRSATLDTLRGLLNVAPDRPQDFMLLVAWMVAALHPAGPYPLLALDGEQGSGKSTTCRMLRKMVDPNKADLRAPPRNEESLVIAAMSARVVALDNVSTIAPADADALCRVATGGGFSKRRNYTDGDEYLAEVCRPVLLNGIPSLLARGDLADRALAVTLLAIPDDKRRAEAEVWRDFAAAAPAVLGLLLDALARALADMSTLHLPRLPRMADFARLVCAAAPAFGWTAGDMMDAIEGNRVDAVEAVIEADPVATAVRGFMEGQHGAWAGTASELLAIVNDGTPDELQRDRAFPKSAGRLSAHLRRIAPGLRRAGWDIVLPTTGGRRGRTIRITPSSATGQQRPVTPDPEPGGYL